MSVWILGFVALSIFGNNKGNLYNSSQDWEPERRSISSTFEMIAKDVKEVKIKTEYYEVKDSVNKQSKKNKLRNQLKSEIKAPVSRNTRKAETDNPFLSGVIFFFDHYGIVIGFIAIVTLFAGFRIIKN